MTTASSGLFSSGPRSAANGQVRDPAAKRSKVQVVYNFGREDAANREALQRPVASVTRFLDPRRCDTADGPPPGRCRGAGLERLAAALDDQGFDKGSPLVGDPIRPGTQPNWSRHHVDLARETAFYPQPGARVLRGDRDHRDGLPVVLPRQPTDELGLALGRGRRGVEADQRHPSYPLGAGIAGSRRALGDNQEGGSVLLGHTQGSAKRVARAIQHHDCVYPRRHALIWPDEETGGRNANNDEEYRQRGQDLTPSPASA